MPRRVPSVALCSACGTGDEGQRRQRSYGQSAHPPLGWQRKPSSRSRKAFRFGDGGEPALFRHVIHPRESGDPFIRPILLFMISYICYSVLKPYTIVRFREKSPKISSCFSVFSIWQSRQRGNSLLRIVSLKPDTPAVGFHDFPAQGEPKDASAIHREAPVIGEGLSGAEGDDPPGQGTTFVFGGEVSITVRAG